MALAHTRRGQSRSGLMAAIVASRPLLKSVDHGDSITIRSREIGMTSERWVEPFIALNRQSFRRLDLQSEVHANPELRLMLKPGSRIGAVPLLSPSTHKVIAGLLIEPRFKWSALGAVLNRIGFSVEPTLGGAPLVPGSAREVPLWMLAGPVIERINALMRHRHRGFIERRERRTSPRGLINWAKWTSHHLSRGDWTVFPCQFSEPDDDPDLMACVRWTLNRLEEDLSIATWSIPTRYLLRRIAELQAEVTPGLAKRPPPMWSLPGSSEWVTAGIEAMTWVAEERGLGGARTLDGLAWDLSIVMVWEAWVAAFSKELGRQLGMVSSPFQESRRLLHWNGPIHSMGALIPDIELRGVDHIVWIDAKYKAHLELLSRRGWQGLSEEIRKEHRADLHQALAYSSLADASQVDTLLVYPHLGTVSDPPMTMATVTSGRRRVRLVLASVPFGFRNIAQETKCLHSFREILTS